MYKIYHYLRSANRTSSSRLSDIIQHYYKGLNSVLISSSVATTSIPLSHLSPNCPLSEPLRQVGWGMLITRIGNLKISWDDAVECSKNLKKFTQHYMVDIAVRWYVYPGKSWGSLDEIFLWENLFAADLTLLLVFPMDVAYLLNQIFNQ